MRTLSKTISGFGVVTVNYPDFNAFLFDNNYIEVVLPKENMEVHYSYYNISTSTPLGDFTYRTPFKKLIISLNSVFNYMTNRYDESFENLINMAIYIPEYSEFNPIFPSLPFNILKGTSYTDRTHGTLYFYLYGNDDPSQTEIYFPVNGTITIDGLYTQNVQAGKQIVDLSNISGEGTHKINFVTSSFAPSVEIASFEPINEYDFTTNINYIENDGNMPFTYIGDLLKKNLQTLDNYNIYFDIVNTCDNDIFEIKYFDADGCIRYLAGKITQITSSANQKNLLYEQDIYGNIPNYAYNGEQKDVTVVFDSINHDAHIEDLLQSISIWYLNNDFQWCKCQLSTKSIKNVENSDYELTFTINKK